MFSTQIVSNKKGTEGRRRLNIKQVSVEMYRSRFQVAARLY